MTRNDPMPLDESLLVAYADGELSAELRARVEAALAHDELARAKLQLLRQSATAVKGAYDDLLTAPMPERLSELFAASPSDERVVAFAPRARRAPPLQRLWLPLAASLLLLVVGFGGGAFWRGIAGDGQLELASGPMGESPAFQMALAQLLASGGGEAVPYEDAAMNIGGQVLPMGLVPTGFASCREFRDERRTAAGSFARGGLACPRVDGGWEILTMPADPAS